MYGKLVCSLDLSLGTFQSGRPGCSYNSLPGSGLRFLGPATGNAVFVSVHFPRHTESVIARQSGGSVEYLASA